MIVSGSPLMTFPPCCVADACGLNVDSAASVLPVSGCIEVAKPGDLDTDCDSIDVDVVGSAVTLPGCCQANGMCGVMVDVTALGSGLGATGPDFGCQDPAPFSDAGTPKACGN